jgi:hypothetical protein
MDYLMIVAINEVLLKRETFLCKSRYIRYDGV